MKAPDVTFFGAGRRNIPRGGLGVCSPGNFYNLEHSKTLFPVFLEPKNQFVSQLRLEPPELRFKK